MSTGPWRCMGAVEDAPGGASSLASPAGQWAIHLLMAALGLACGILVAVGIEQRVFWSPALVPVVLGLIASAAWTWPAVRPLWLRVAVFAGVATAAFFVLGFSYAARPTF